jgi:hypothetical protein
MPVIQGQFFTLESHQILIGMDMTMLIFTTPVVIAMMKRHSGKLHHFLKIINLICLKNMKGLLRSLVVEL